MYGAKAGAGTLAREMLSTFLSNKYVAMICKVDRYEQYRFASSMCYCSMD